MAYQFDVLKTKWAQKLITDTKAQRAIKLYIDKMMCSMETE